MFSGDDFDLSDAVLAAQAVSMFGDRVIVVRNASRFNVEALGPLIAYADDPNPTSRVLVVWDKPMSPSGHAHAVPKKLTDAVKACGGVVSDSDVSPNAKVRQGWLDEHLPGFWGIGVTVDGQLQAVNLSCVLSRSVWCSHTERYRPGILAYCNQLAFREACRVVDPAQLPWVNDGSAEAPVVPGVNNLASFKARLTHHTLVPYTV